MTLEELLAQLPNFLGMGVAILVLIRQVTILQEVNQKLTDIIVTKQNCSNIENSPPADKQHVPTGQSATGGISSRTEVDWKDKSPA